VLLIKKEKTFFLLSHYKWWAFYLGPILNMSCFKGCKHLTRVLICTFLEYQYRNQDADLFFLDVEFNFLEVLAFIFVLYSHTGTLESCMMNGLQMNRMFIRVGWFSLEWDWPKWKWGNWPEWIGGKCYISSINFHVLFSSCR